MEDYLKPISLFTDQVIYVGPMQGKNSEIPEFLKPLEFLLKYLKKCSKKFNEQEIKKLCEKYENFSCNGWWYLIRN